MFKEAVFQLEKEMQSLAICDREEIKNPSSNLVTKWRWE